MESKFIFFEVQSLRNGCRIYTALGQEAVGLKVNPTADEVFDHWVRTFNRLTTNAMSGRKRLENILGCYAHDAFVLPSDRKPLQKAERDRYFAALIRKEAFRLSIDQIDYQEVGEGVAVYSGQCSFSFQEKGCKTEHEHFTIVIMNGKIVLHHFSYQSPVIMQQ